MNTLGGAGLWDETDGFYYDQIRFDTSAVPLKTRSMVGLLPLIAAEVLEEESIQGDRKSTRLNSSHGYISYAVFCLKKKQKISTQRSRDGPLPRQLYRSHRTRGYPAATTGRWPRHALRYRLRRHSHCRSA